MHIAAFKDNSTAPYANVTITSTDGWNTYSPVMYWPEFYETVHFFASSPNEGNSLFVPSYTTGNAGYSTQLSYSVPVSEEELTGNDAIAQTDLIYAIAPNKNETQSGAVELYFSHLLSAVIFNIPTTIGDAAVSDAKIELNNIISAGDCTVSYSENGNNISWDIPDSPSRETYTQKINDGETTFPDGESFKLIPQILSESNATFTISFKVGNAEHSYSGDLNALTDEWKFNRRYTYTITKREEVKVNVQANMTESNNQPHLKDVKILNTGFTTSYIRAAIVGYWYVNETIEEDGTNIEIESIASAWEIDDTSTGTIRYSSDWSEKWKKGNDGFYYHLQPVRPGEYTSTLFEDYVLLRTTGPVTGSQLKIHIAVQAIEASEASLKWPELTTGN